MKKHLLLFSKTRQLFLFIFLLAAACLQAQAPKDYYKNAYNTSGFNLKTALSGIIKNHTERTYNNLWEDFKTTDKKSDGKVWDMYSNCSFTFTTNQCGTYAKECDCYNREHSMPKSWFGDSTPMYTDLFHLYPTDGKVNGMRSNYPFGRVGTVTYSAPGGAKLGNSNYPGYTGIVFEPTDEYKGDFARSYFYMVTCYESRVSGWNSEMLNHSSGQAFTDWAKSLLLEWHRADPVSQKEIERNNAVYAIQKNRNPFIDYPQLVEKIWGNDNTPFIDPNAPPSGNTKRYLEYTLTNAKGETIKKDSVLLNP